MIALLLSAITWACSPTALDLGQARLAFDDAEIASADAILARAEEQLRCQAQPVSRPTLLELYRLRALVALAAADDRTAIEATMLAVVVDPLATPPPEYGPELLELHRTWAGRLSDKRVTVDVVGGGKVFVDGEPLLHGQRLSVVRGRHLVQIEGKIGLVSSVENLEGDQTLRTGRPVPGPARADVLASRPVGPKPAVVEPDGRRRRPLALWVTTGVLAAAGGGLATLAALQERDFHESTYADWQVVDRDAVRIRSMYGAGYGLLGAAGLSVVTVSIGLPPRKR